MLTKKVLARKFVAWTHEWNSAIHEAVEERIFDEYKENFPNGAADSEVFIEKMRTFYYTRMVNTATLLLTSVSIFIAVAALILAGAPFLLSK